MYGVLTVCCTHFSAFRDDQMTPLLLMRDKDVVAYLLEAFRGARVFASSLCADGCLEPAESAAVACDSVAYHGSTRHRKDTSPKNATFQLLYGAFAVNIALCSYILSKWKMQCWVNGGRERQNIKYM